MKILLTNDALDRRGGSESYLETIAWALRRLEHTVVFYSPHNGQFADRLRSHGFDVFDSVPELPDDIDVIHGQHVSAVLLVRARFDNLPLVFASHSWFVPIEDPLVTIGASAFLAFNDFTQSRLRAHAATTGKPIHRLTQPVDISFGDSARVAIAERPRTAVSVSRSQNVSLAQIDAACAKLGITLINVGLEGTESLDAREQMLAADIVFAIGRSALEGMAAARAVFLVDESAMGGWVTAESYESYERDGFTGLGSADKFEDLGVALDHYSTALGRDARRLAVKHHAGQRHAADLVAIYASVLGERSSVGPVDSVTILSAENMGLESRLAYSEWSAARRLREIESMRRTLSWRITRPFRILSRIGRRKREAPN